MKATKLMYFSVILISTFFPFDICFSQWEKAGSFDYSKDIPIKFYYNCCDKIIEGGDGIYISTDDGINWIDPGYEIYNPTSITGFASNIFIGCVDIEEKDPRVIFRSTNCGNNWEEVSPKNFRFPNVFSLCSNGSDIIVGTANGIYITKDLGENWININGNLPFYRDNDPYIGPVIIISDVAVLGENILSLLFSSGLFISTNKGDNWLPVKCPQGDFIHNMVTFENNIMLCMSDGIYLSNTLGNSWKKVSEGLPNHISNVEKLFVTEKFIFAVFDKSYWRISKDDIRRKY